MNVSSMKFLFLHLFQLTLFSIIHWNFGIAEQYNCYYCRSEIRNNGFVKRVFGGDCIEPSNGQTHQIAKKGTDIGCMKTITTFDEKTEISRSPVEWDNHSCQVKKRVDIDNMVSLKTVLIFTDL